MRVIPSSEHIKSIMRNTADDAEDLLPQDGEPYTVDDYNLQINIVWAKIELTYEKHHIEKRMYEKGYAIEARRIGTKKWTRVVTPSWLDDYEYRVRWPKHGVRMGDER